MFYFAEIKKNSRGSGGRSPPEAEAFLADKVVILAFLVHIWSQHSNFKNVVQERACSHSCKNRYQMIKIRKKFNFAEDWNWVGGLGDEVPQKQTLFSCLYTD